MIRSRDLLFVMSGLIKCFSLSREEFSSLQEENNHYKSKLDRLEVSK